MYLQLSWFSVWIRVGLLVFIIKSRFAFCPHFHTDAQQLLTSPNPSGKDTLTLSNQQGKLWLLARCLALHPSADNLAFWQTGIKTPGSF